MSRKNKNKVRVPLPQGVTKREAVRKLRAMRELGVTTLNGAPTLLDAAEHVRVDKDVQTAAEIAPDKPDLKTVIS